MCGAAFGYRKPVIGRAFFLCSILKGLDAYPRPFFWSALYLLYLAGAEYMWPLMLGQWKAPLLHAILGWGVSYGVFRGLKELQNGPPYWALLLVGFFVMMVILP